MGPTMPPMDYAEFIKGMNDIPVLKDCADNLNSLFAFEIVAFMLVDEQDQAFKLRYCEPAEQSAFISAEIDYQIDKGIFSWSLGQTKPVIEKTRNELKKMILYPLATRNRIKGMFIGIIDNVEPQTQLDSLYFLTILLLSISHTLHNQELYHYIQSQNQRLEETVKQRTHELENAKIAAETANRSKSEFLAMMSHEIRTPLTAILGYADLMGYGQLKPSEYQPALNSILNATTHLSSLVNDILDLSKIEANKLEIETIPMPLFNCLDGLNHAIKAQANEKGLSLTIDYQFPLPTIIYTDPTRLKQILLNLYHNAVKFTEAGGVSIKVGYIPEQKRITFSIIDSGIGMSEAQQAKLFQDFVQADVSTFRQYGGSGLGLMISKQLAEKLGGHISVSSKPGKGTCFEVVIPAGPVDEETLVYFANEVPDTEKLSNPFAGLEKSIGHVLLAEDNLDNQKFISLLLAKAGISVDVVASGNSVVEKALTQHYDVILMDMYMPEMNGLDATRLLRDAGYDGTIIALTANATLEAKRQCHDVGFDGFLSKPIEINAFFETLNQYLKSATEQEASILDNPEFRLIQNEFIEALPGVWKEMDSAFEQQNWPVLKSLAHQLKGVSGSYGFPELGEIAGNIEAHIERGRIDALAELMGQLRPTIEVIKK